jgi:hypothetical protein
MWKRWHFLPGLRVRRQFSAFHVDRGVGGWTLFAMTSAAGCTMGVIGVIKIICNGLDYFVVRDCLIEFV